MNPYHGMKTIIQWIGKALRLLLLPFPLAFSLGFAALNIIDHLLRPDRSRMESGTAGEFIGEILLLLTVAGLQIVIGAPSLLVLDANKAGPRGYLLVASVMAVFMSLTCSMILQSPGETFGWMLPRVFAFLGIPIMLSYWRAFVLRRPKTR